VTQTRHDTNSASSLSETTAPPTDPQWSVVVIARNEEGSITTCLESVLHAFAARSYELIFVDSASTDDTVLIASRFPAKIICIPPTERLSPSLGRRTGAGHARGQWIMFLDGDCTVNADWIDEAGRILTEQPDLGALAGERVQILAASRSHAAAQYNYPYPDQDYTAADFLSGSAVYTRRALNETGGFNPYLRSCEEAELGARLRKAGFRLLRLRSTMSWHSIKHPNETPSELLRRIERGFFLGSGQFVRYCYVQRLPVIRPFDSIRRSVQFCVLLLIGLMAAATSLVTRDGMAFGAWVGLMLAIFVIFVVRNRGIRKPAYYFLEWTLTAPIVVWGFLQPPRMDWKHAQPAAMQSNEAKHSDIAAV
jgi:glycosyltransferase involved in cell wall biosynthesis